MNTYRTTPLAITLLALSLSTQASSLDQLRYETETAIRQHTESPSIPVIIPQIHIQGDPYRTPIRPYPNNPTAPQYLINPHTNQIEQIR